MPLKGTTLYKKAANLQYMGTHIHIRRRIITKNVCDNYFDAWPAKDRRSVANLALVSVRAVMMLF